MYFVGAWSDFVEFEFDYVVGSAAAHMQDAAGDGTEFTAVALLPEMQELVFGSGISFETADVKLEDGAPFVFFGI